MQAGNTASMTVIGIEHGLTVSSTASRSMPDVVHVGRNIINYTGLKSLFGLFPFFPLTMLEYIFVL